MNRLRRWSPGREFTAAIGGHSWYAETDDALTVAVVLGGYTGSNRPEVLAEFGPWDVEADQLWIATIPKDVFYVTNELFDPPVEGDDVPFYYWHWARAELFDKPHRVIGIAADHGAIVSRAALAEIHGVRHVGYYGVVRYEDARDARAVRLWQQASLRGGMRRAAVARRWRKYRDAETWHPGSYKGAGRKYYSDRKDPR